MEIPVPLRNLATMLEVQRQSSRPYHLLLTSTISLTPEILIKICKAADWQTFRNHLHGFGVRNRQALLNSYLTPSKDEQGYDALVHLIIKGYFSVLLTTNLDDALETALSRKGLYPPNSYRKLIVGLEQDEHVADVLENLPDGIHIIKLHGSLNDSYLPKEYPDFFELPPYFPDRETIDTNISIINTHRKAVIQLLKDLKPRQDIQDGFSELEKSLNGIIKDMTE